MKLTERAVLAAKQAVRIEAEAVFKDRCGELGVDTCERPDVDLFGQFSEIVLTLNLRPWHASEPPRLSRGFVGLSEDGPMVIAIRHARALSYRTRRFELKQCKSGNLIFQFWYITGEPAHD